MAFPPTVGVSYRDGAGRRWTVNTVIQSGFREVLLVPHADEGRTASAFRILEEEWPAWEAQATVI